MILFIKSKYFNARTVDNDIKILRDIKMYEVEASIKAFVKQFFYLLFNIRKYKAVWIWFADYHSFFPVFFGRLFGVKTIINIGGYDAFDVLPSKPKTIKEALRKFCVWYSVRFCSKLFPVSDTIRAWLPRKCETIYCCIDTNDFKDGLKEKLIITVGGGGYLPETKRKRLDFFIEIGEEFIKRYPDTKFWIIGHDKGTKTYEYLKRLCDKVEIKPMTGLEELREYYSRASVYMQLSYYEAFGIAQIEAMYSGCIPVSYKSTAEIVNGGGFIVEDFDKEKYIGIIKEILDGKHEPMRIKAKQRASEFSLEARKKKILKWN